MTGVQTCALPISVCASWCMRFSAVFSTDELVIYQCSWLTIAAPNAPWVSPARLDVWLWRIGELFVGMIQNLIPNFS